MPSPKRRRAGALPLRPLLALAGALVLASLVVLAAWLVALDRQVVRQFEGRRWNLPAQVYARPLEVYAGLRLGAEEFQAELTALGYSRTDQPRSQGSYSRGGTRFRLVTRPFQFWDGRQEPQAATVLFGPGGVTALTGPDGSDLPLLRLDPPFIGNIFTVHGEDRVVLPPDQVPKLLTDTLKVVEDRDFDEHIGVSFRGIARAMLANVRAGSIEQGASTLTQQLVRSYFLSNERTLSRKLREAAMAILLEAHFEKDDLLNAYVNEIYLGQAGDRAIHGFGLASQFYFGRPLTELEPAEIALLVAVVRGPSLYDPRRNPETARKRRDLVLDLMAEFSLLTPEAAAKARSQPLGVRGKASTFASYNPTFMDRVRRELRDDYDDDDLLNAGLRIMTNLDPRLQALAERRLAEGLAELEKTRRKQAGSLDGAVVITGSQTPDIVAIVGGRNLRMQGFNRALDAKRPIGSLVKPAVFLAALQTGQFTLASTLLDAPLTLKLDTGKEWAPENYDRQYRGDVTLARALAESLNLPTVRLGLEVGTRKVATTLRSLGTEKAPPALPSLLLGAVDLTPLEVAQVYQSLASGGFRAPLKAVRAVLDAEGKALARTQLSVDRAADPAAVYQVNAALVEVFERGTARGAKGLLPAGLVVAGKTGTSNDLRDSWFAGFTNDHVAVVWVGADDNRPTGLSGASGALPIWARIVAGFGDNGYEPVPVTGVTEQWFDYDTGFAADPGCADLVRLPLPDGTELPPKPGCEPRAGGGGGMNWLRDLFN
ncbi:MAG: penicillin-binding protein 1B [Chromatiales bacterium]|nr:penicillin-binding protein 1B [Chromatiales bacterium]